MSTSGSKQAAGSVVGGDRRVVLLALGQGTFSPDVKALAGALRAEGFAVISSELVALPERVRRLGPFAVVVETELPHAPEVIERMRQQAPTPLVVALGPRARLLALGVAVDPDVPDFSHPVDVLALASFLGEKGRATTARATSSAPGTEVPSSVGPGTGVGTGVGPAAHGSRPHARGSGLGEIAFATDSEAMLADFPAIAGLSEVESLLPDVGTASVTGTVGRLSPEIEALLEQCERRVSKMDRGEGLARLPSAADCLPDEVMAQLDDLLASDGQPVPATTSGPRLGAGLATARPAHDEPAEPRPTPDEPAEQTPHDSLPPATTHQPELHAALAEPHGGHPDVPVPPPHLPSEPPPRRPPSEFPRTSPGAQGTPSAPPPGERAPSAPPPANDGAPPGAEAGEGDLQSRPALPFDAAEGEPAEGPSTDGAPPTRAQLPSFVARRHAPQPGSSPPPAEALAAALHPSVAEPARRDAPRAPTAARPAALAAPERGDPIDLLARAIRARATGVLRLEPDEGAARQVVLRDGDVVTVVSEQPAEALCQFLVERGDLDPEVARARATKLPQGGRHAAAALIANGFLGQDDLWPILRAHAEWILARALNHGPTTARLDPDPAEPVRAEPNVFGGATGAEVFVELVRRIVSSEQAVARLGGAGTRLRGGSAVGMLAESALPADDLETVRSAHEGTVGQLLGRCGHDAAALVLALAALGVLEPTPPSRPAGHRAAAEPDPLDADAVRRRVTARLTLVREGDYFALLGVARDATAYDIRRAYLELRRSLEPTRLLTAATADLAADVDLIVEVLEEAYEVLRDTHRRNRYRRAIEATQ